MPAQKPASSTSLDGVLFNVIDDDPSGGDPAVGLQRVNNKPRALELVLQVRRVDEDQLPVPGRQIDVLLKDRQFVAAVLVQPDFADAQNSRPIQKFAG